MSGLRWSPITWRCLGAYSRPESLAQKAEGTLGNDRFPGLVVLENLAGDCFRRVLVRLLKYGTGRCVQNLNSSHRRRGQFEKYTVSGRTLVTTLTVIYAKVAAPIWNWFATVFGWSADPLNLQVSRKISRSDIVSPSFVKYIGSFHSEPARADRQLSLVFYINRPFP
jgi:hypothetical protein